MQISFVNIRNFRKLKDVRIDFCNDTTLFVGANNSGKTSAMDALRKFLVRGDGNNFVYNDLIVINRKAINGIGSAWTEEDAIKPIDLFDWIEIIPTMDIWFEVGNSELHYVANIIPTLNWTGGRLGVRLSLLPKDIGKLFDDYCATYSQSRLTESSDKNEDKVKLYPQDLCEFIERNLTQHFEIKAFILDPEKIDMMQPTDFDCECMEKNPLSGLIKIDMIYAQRGFSDADSSNEAVSLSQQLRTYYDKHLDIEKKTSPEDLETFSALQKARKTFDVTLATKFKDSFTELEKLGFPGIADPKITIESKFKEKTAFEHESAVHYALTDENASLRLPERYNGLGYQNLISIAFKLMSFRDGRIHKGKAISDENAERVAPLHLILLEEPEAHLHVQVQQVLIKKAYEILTDSAVLKNDNFKTQLIVSTHSSHIAKESPFKSIRYFRRAPAMEQMPISISEVVNLTNAFGADEKTEKFVQRYLRVTHCDLFFADAVIFVEGTSETVLVPYFINIDYPELDSRYITILPIGGSHSHRFKPLVEKLGIFALIITDIDAAKPSGHHKGVMPKRNANLITSNSSIKEWCAQERILDELLNLPYEDKELLNGQVRIAYQMPIALTINDTNGEALSATFEDSLTYSNCNAIQELYEKDKELPTKERKFRNSDAIAKISTALGRSTIEEVFSEIYRIIRNKSNDKVSFALDLIYWLARVESPTYIKEGLEWLEGKLRRAEIEVAAGGNNDA